ncbi:NADH-quinone oxidoreductase subunit C [Streptomyces pilosus]|uniref:Dehydrogenase n=1 Tax=Streptomyces pilosus TaxID=28893 RepID=A0A918EYW1_9ACTN|nr:NADH-quinone oxidoreductase subunit C [Streptomyces pilosus]GGQ82305.1 dehydrogenase [Streptomyces pilosus]
MTATGWLPAGTEELFGTGATAEESYGVLTVDVPPASWTTALETARDRLGCTFFDWLSAVDEPGTGFRVTAHVAALSPVRRLLLRTTVPHEAPVLPSAVGVYAGAAWHERETHEMFGVGFTGHPGLDHLLLPDTFEGHPLRKDFVLAARVAKAWPGAKEPGESEHGGAKRRQMLPPGVPDPNEWGPLKGQLPPAPARPARRAATAAGRPPGERPPRRTRTASEGSASQTGADAGAAAGAGAGAGDGGDRPPVAPRRARSAAEGSASQAAAPESPVAPRRNRSASEGPAGRTAQERPEQAAPPARRARSASEGSASQRPAPSAAGDGPRRARSASEGSASQRAVPEETSPADDGPTPGPTPTGTGRPDDSPPAAPRSPDAPWHHARPAFTEPTTEPATEPTSEPAARPGAEPDAKPGAEPDAEPGTEPGAEPAAEPGAEPAAEPGAEPAAEPGAEPETQAGTGDGTGTTTPEDPAGGPR